MIICGNLIRRAKREYSGYGDVLRRKNNKGKFG
jgi:hypothetical protein